MPKKGSRKKEGRVTTTNIKVTTETHREVQVAAELLGVTQSEVISDGLRKLLPNLTEEIKRREEIRANVERNSKLTSN